MFAIIIWIPEWSTSNVLKIKLGIELRSDMFVYEPCDATRE